MAGGTVTFTFTDSCDDDGKNCTSTITPSGTLTGLTTSTSVTLAADADTIHMGSATSIGYTFRVHPEDHNGNSHAQYNIYDDGLNDYGLYNGQKRVTSDETLRAVNTPGYIKFTKADFAFQIELSDHNYFQLDPDDLINGNYSPTGTIEFDRDLLTVMKDDDFKFEIPFTFTSGGSRDTKLVFKTAKRPDAPGNPRAVKGDGQVSLTWDKHRRIWSGSTQESVSEYQIRQKKGSDSYSAGAPSVIPPMTATSATTSPA